MAKENAQANYDSMANLPRKQGQIISTQKFWDATTSANKEVVMHIKSCACLQPEHYIHVIIIRYDMHNKESIASTHIDYHP